MKINAKVYYETSTGNVLLITSEMQGYVQETTKEQDIKLYPELQGKTLNEVDYIELEYGTLATTFINVKSYKVNVDTKKLEVIKYTQEELDIINKQDQATQDLNARIADLSNYLLNSDETTISDIENSVLEIEKNKTINGGM